MDETFFDLLKVSFNFVINLINFSFKGVLYFLQAVVDWFVDGIYGVDGLIFVLHV